MPSRRVVLAATLFAAACGHPAPATEPRRSEAQAGPVPARAAQATLATVAEPRARGACSTSGWCWLHPLPRLVPGAAWSDGTVTVAVGTRGEILRVTGGGMRFEPAPTTATLYAVWGPSAETMFAVGAGGTVLRYGSGQWTAMASPTLDDLVAIWGTSDRDVYAAGGRGALLHFDGHAWQEERRHPAEKRHILKAIWGSGPRDVYVAGEPAILIHFDGKAWSRIQHAGLAGDHGFHALWGSGPRDVWAFSAYQTALHFDGRAWSSERLPAGGYGVAAAWGSSARDVRAVDVDGSFMRYDGSTWKLAGTVKGGWPFVLDRDGRAFFAGSADALALVERGEARPTASARFSGKLTALTVTRSGELFLGAGNALVQLKVEGLERVGSEARVPLDALSASSAEELWAVGGNVVLHGDPRAPYETTIADEELRGIWARSGEGAHVVSRSGVIRRGDGKAWTEVARVADETLNAITGCGDAIFAVGSGGAVLRRAGGSWLRERAGSEYLSGVWCASDGVAFAVARRTTDGQRGVSVGGVVRFERGAWTEERVPADTPGLNAIWGASAAEIYAVGDAGAILRFDGRSWTREEPETRADLFGVAGTERGVYVAGSTGVVLRRAR